MAAKTSLFAEVPLAPPDAVFGLQKEFSDDSHPQKVNLGVGGMYSIYHASEREGPALLL